ncbi:MAG: HAD-IB family phosphatase [Sphingobium sp.]|nr:HAD-IB family phosphatase [Sphingobium sp.]MBP6111634.1 HAD-IB family phosphatase [Sphingobium sp.]MBP8671209.1 HAD-IB family phosphatase [Sphingobium sp.]MBP9158206.1 HAD-IB family phosphatase [Sphingobium sp.]
MPAYGGLMVTATCTTHAQMRPTKPGSAFRTLNRGGGRWGPRQRPRHWTENISAAWRLMIGGRVSRARLKPHIESYAEAVLAKNVRAGALARIAQDKAEGYTLVLATASYRLYVDAIARRLGFDAVIATDHLGQDLDYVRARIAGDNCYDAAKLRMITDWMAGEGIPREAAHIRAYSDHVSDAPMLQFADEPYAANPHKPLAELAGERGWPRVDWG